MSQKEKGLIGIVIFLASLYLLFPDAVMNTRSHNLDDASNYLLSARSLARGKGFGPEYVDGFIPMLNQTPLFSYLLVPVVSLFGFNFLALKLWMVFLAFLTSGACTLFFRKYLPSRVEALFALALFISSPVIFSLSHDLLSEIPFIGFFLLAVCAWEDVLKGKGGVFLAGSAAFLAALAFYTRLVGIAIPLGAWFLWLHPSVRRKKSFGRLFFLSLCMAVLIFPSFYRSATVKGEGGWLGHPAWFYFIYPNPEAAAQGAPGLVDLFVRIKNNLTWGMLQNIALLLFAPFYFIREGAVSLVLSLPFVAFTLWRWAAASRRAPRLVEGIFLAWVLTLLLFTHGHALRYITPVLPFLILYLLDFAEKHVPKRWIAPLAALFLGVSVLSTVVYAVDHRRDPYGTLVQREYVEAGMWARQHLPKDATYFAAMPHRWQVVTEGRAYQMKPETVALVLQGRGPGYLLTFRDPDEVSTYDLESVRFHHPSETLQVSRYVQAHPEGFSEVYRNQLFSLYKKKIPPKPEPF